MLITCLWYYKETYLR